MNQIKAFLLVLAILTLFPFKALSQEKPKDLTREFKIVCLGGHQYWFRNLYSYGGFYESLAIKLDDNGKPIKCS